MAHILAGCGTALPALWAQGICRCCTLFTEGFGLTGKVKMSARTAPILIPLLAVGLAVSACGRKSAPAALADDTRLMTIGVNAYLWRAALETMEFMPLSQVDSTGGVIIGDWYRSPDIPNERVKVTVAILDGALRADAVQVSAAREVIQNGQWVAVPVRAGTVQKLEEVILEKARVLRQAAAIRN